MDCWACKVAVESEVSRANAAAEATDTGIRTVTLHFLLVAFIPLSSSGSVQVSGEFHDHLGFRCAAIVAKPRSHAMPRRADREQHDQKAGRLEKGSGSAIALTNMPSGLAAEMLRNGGVRPTSASRMTFVAALKR